MAKTLERRIAQLEKLISDFFTATPKKSPRKAKARKPKKSKKPVRPRKSVRTRA